MHKAFWFIALSLILFASYTLAEESSQNEGSSSTTEVTKMEEDTSEERKKKGGMEKLYMALMVFKSGIGSFFQLISAIIQIKSFKLAVIGTLINLGRFLLQLKQHSDKGGFGGGGGGGGGLGGGGFFGGDDLRRVATIPPLRIRPGPPISPYYRYSPSSS